MNILISGGWGYGNLGDDAILHATLKLLLQIYPSANIRVLSYDPQTTEVELNNKFLVYESVHRVLFGTSAFKQLMVYNKVSDIYCKYPILDRIRNRMVYEVNRLLLHQEKKRPVLNSLQINKLFKTADLFIMSGGGYFNNWYESLISRMEELKLAQKYGIRHYIIGQTLDSFSAEYKEELQSLLKNVTAISVRDLKSHDELASMGIKSLVAPDLALSGFNLDKVCNTKEFGEIVFIPAELPLNCWESIVDTLSHYAKDHDIKIRIVVTRLYNSDIFQAKRCLDRFKKNKVEVKFRIPKNFKDVCEDLTQSKFVISRNLHGLILGYVRGANVLALNDTWKFRGFMEQINASEMIVNLNNFDTLLFNAQIEKLLNQSWGIEIRRNLKDQVESNFKSILES